MSQIEKIEALLAGITREDLYRLPHEQAVRLARALRRVADVAEGLERSVSNPERLSGPLAQLRTGERAEDSDEFRCPRPEIGWSS